MSKPATTVVLDTNVLVHASNPYEGNFASSVKLCEKLVKGSAEAHVDSGFDLVEASNRSRIAGEYFRFLKVGSVGYETIRRLATAGRLVVLSSKVDRAVRRIVVDLVADNTDRIFVYVAINTRDKFLVSHDDEAFPLNICESLKADLGVRVCDAHVACSHV